MGSDATKLLEDALKLPPEARAAMAGSLLESLDATVDVDAEAEWNKEIARRLKDLDSPHPPLLVSWSDARRKILGL
ncbi:MAG: addiction module protein [Nitrospirota bacterium]